MCKYIRGLKRRQLNADATTEIERYPIFIDILQKTARGIQSVKGNYLVQPDESKLFGMWKLKQNYKKAFWKKHGFVHIWIRKDSNIHFLVWNGQRLSEDSETVYFKITQVS